MFLRDVLDIILFRFASTPSPSSEARLGPSPGGAPRRGLRRSADGTKTSGFRMVFWVFQDRIPGSVCVCVCVRFFIYMLFIFRFPGGAEETKNWFGSLCDSKKNFLFFLRDSIAR